MQTGSCHDASIFAKRTETPKQPEGAGGDKLGKLGEAGGASRAAENESLSFVTSGSGSACCARLLM